MQRSPALARGSNCIIIEAGVRSLATCSRRSGMRSTGSAGILCTSASSRTAMADVQDDVHQELVWDQRALAAAELLTDARVGQAGVTLPVAGLFPSLHLNLGECFRKLGELGRAREHL